MPEAAKIFGYFSALLLIASVVIWAILLRGPILQRLDGRRPSNSGLAEVASRLLATALGLSTLGAILAIAGRIIS